jgi:peroxiredoxin (alkyl hydroperoxide reductase subunit C)
VCHQVVNDLPLGRNIDEMLRLVDALNFHEQHGEVCPAGWQQCSKDMVDSPQGIANYLAENAANL